MARVGWLRLLGLVTVFVTLGLAADGPALGQAPGTEIPPAGERPRDSQDRPEGGRSPIYDHIMQADISLILDCLRVREIVQIWADGDMEERERASQELEQILQREYHRMVRQAGGVETRAGQEFVRESCVYRTIRQATQSNDGEFRSRARMVMDNIYWPRTVYDPSN